MQKYYFFLTLANIHSILLAFFVPWPFVVLRVIIFAVNFSLPLRICIFFTNFAAKLISDAKL